MSHESQKRRRFRDPVGYLLETVKYRAKKNGVEFTITRDDIVIPSHCPIFGIELFFMEAGSDNKVKNPNAPSIDRIDSTKGYIPGNVLICSWRANFLKNDSTVDELQKLAMFYAALAHPVEQLTCNQQVVCSSQTGGTN